MFRGFVSVVAAHGRVGRFYRSKRGRVRDRPGKGTSHKRQHKYRQKPLHEIPRVEPQPIEPHPIL